MLTDYRKIDIVFGPHQDSRHQQKQMSFVTSDEDKRRAEKAARYLIEQHGDDATTEAEAALRNAIELNDKPSIETVTDILAVLRGTRST